MRLTVFDIGGSSVKHALWVDETLQEQSSFPTPETWEDMKTELLIVLKKHRSLGLVDGVAISAPGAVDAKNGIIGGCSAVPYIHNIFIQKELETLFNLPVDLENDANCAALAELFKGAAKDVDHALFLVIGSGIGGAIIQNRKLHKGRNLFGGEFGFMLLNDTQTLSDLGSPVEAAKRYRKEMNLDLVDGTFLFKEADRGEPVAVKHVENLIDSLARGIYNLSTSFNPDLVIIGGGISNRTDIVERITEKTKYYLNKYRAGDLELNIVSCAFRSEANLVGAVVNFLENRNS
ncbi:MAG: ROK family protein [Clostridiaceae bacterium]